MTRVIFRITQEKGLEIYIYIYIYKYINILIIKYKSKRKGQENLLRLMNLLFYLIHISNHIYQI